MFEHLSANTNPKGASKPVQTPELSEQFCRPLGMGFDDYPALLQQYAYPPDSPGQTPDLGVSLAGLERAGAFPVIDLQLANSPRCLIQGITSPRNGTCLREFLESRGVRHPSIHAIDIANVPAVLAAMNIPFPDVHFSVADAASLSFFATSSVQILVQDHLLNCTPHETHDDVIREAARILDPRGFLILNFSVNPGAVKRKFWDRAELEAFLGTPLKERAYCLRDLVGDFTATRGNKDVLSGTMVALGSGRSIMITPPKGNFEFYFSKAELEQRLTRYGLKFVTLSSEAGVDRNGFHCLRYRTIVRHVHR
jgi:SAM-dependent methyltransferase